MEHIKTGLQILLIGVIAGVGMRAAEWLIPPPEIRVIVCTGSEIDKAETCTRLQKLVAKHGG